ncbi:MAG: hypothetical protein WCT77_02990 [Bacteroidota bacterium]|jgi:hypothetical protein
MLQPISENPVILIKTIVIGEDYKINDWLQSMRRMRIKVLDIQTSHNYVTIIYESFTGNDESLTDNKESITQ